MKTIIKIYYLELCFNHIFSVTEILLFWIHFINLVWRCLSHKFNIKHYRMNFIVTKWLIVVFVPGDSDLGSGLANTDLKNCWNCLDLVLVAAPVLLLLLSWVLLLTVLLLLLLLLLFLLVFPIWGFDCLLVFLLWPVWTRGGSGSFWWALDMTTFKQQQ